MARRARRPAAASAQPAMNYSQECLERLAHILVLSGHPPQQLQRQFRQICGRLQPPSTPFDPSRPAFLADLPHILSLWHSEPEYLSADGRPAVLPLHRRGVASLGALIRRILPQDAPRSVVQALLRTRGIRASGTGYVPTGRHLSYRDASGRVYSLNVLLRMLRTVDRNLSGDRKHAIFERSAVHPAFPIQALKSFHRGFKGRAYNFLLQEDEQLRRFAQEVSGGARTRAGVAVFTFEDPVSISASKPGLQGGKRAARSKPRSALRRTRRS